MNHPIKSKHQFINASAGTGKTFTIMEIMMDLIEDDYKISEKNNPNILSKILILTFTEKATGELKKRLREKLQEKIQVSTNKKNNSKDPKFKNINVIPNLDYTVYLQNLDLCNISTIHGFCNMVIREYELETLTYEGSSLVPIQEKIKQALYNIQHNEWFVKSDLGKKNLIDLLHSTKYFNEGKEFVTYAAESYLAGREYSPHWEEFKDFEKGLEESIEIPTDVFSDLKDSIASFVNKLEEFHIADYLNGKLAKKYINYWNTLNDLFLNLKPDDTLSLIEIDDFLISDKVTRTENKIELHGIEVFYFSIHLFKIDYKSHFDDNFKNESIRIMDALKPIFNQSFSNLKNNFLGYTIYLTIKILKEELQKSKWISYDQMIQIVNESIQSNPVLVQSLRERFDICIVDEFQDTDQNQYEIFRKVFLEDSKDTGKSLIVIGDPKQSIYGFRGADMETYFQAEEDLKNFRRKEHLDTNYRSVPELVEAYNQIFFGEKDSPEQNTFFPIKELTDNSTSQILEKYKINYEKVKSPTELKIHLDEKFKEGPIHFIRITQSEQANIGYFKSSWAEYIANEIIKLVDSKTGFQYKKENEVKTLSYSDIAILVESKNQGLLIQQFLKRKSIPYSYYKERGIYQSPEAYQVKNIFECLLDPNRPSSYRKLLLCDLFQIHPSYLTNFDEHSIESYEKSIIDKWKNLVQVKKFAELFRSIEQDTKILWNQKDYNIIWERKITNYRQIFNKLLQFQIKNRSDLRELSQELEKMIQDLKSEEEQPLFDKETEKDAVQILTLHAAKGLEWPIVFLFPFKWIDYKLKKADAPVWDETLARRVWKMHQFHSINEEYKTKNLNENKRLYYVGITRAQLRLYLPDLEYFAKDQLYYKRIIQSRISSIRRILEESKSNKNFTFIDWSPPNEASSITKNIKSIKTNSVHKSNSIFHYFDIKNSPKSNRLLSYSSLAKFSSEMNALLPESNSKKNIDDEQDVTLIDTESIYDIMDHFLPLGKETGEYLHKLLELIPFNIYYAKNKNLLFTNQENEWDTILLQSFIRYGVYKKSQAAGESIKSIEDFVKSNFRKETNQILWNTTNALIPLENGKNIKLSLLNKNDYVSEMLFHYKSYKDNLIKGYVDLIFIKDGKFYISDYKSNHLEDPSPDGILQKIQDESSSYYLQRDLYALVLLDYLIKLYDEEEALSKFGGVHFFFLRYMKEGNSEGIYSDINSPGQKSWTKERFINIQNDLNLRIEPIMQIIP